MSVTVSCAFILEVEPEGKKEKKKKKEEEEIVSYHLLNTIPCSSHERPRNTH